jgi:hypothetical protein
MTHKPKAGKKRSMTLQWWIDEATRANEEVIKLRAHVCPPHDAQKDIKHKIYVDIPPHVCAPHEHNEKCEGCYNMYTSGKFDGLQQAPKLPTVIECKHPAPTPIIVTVKWGERMAWLFFTVIVGFVAWGWNIPWVGGAK